MRTIAWAFDGAFVGSAAGVAVAACVTEGAAYAVPVALLLGYTPRGLWVYVGVFVALSCVLGVASALGLRLLLALRRFIRPDLAPASFAAVGLMAGLAVAGVWLGVADWDQCGSCVCIYSSPAPEHVGVPLVMAWGAGSMVWVPVFGVMRVVARDWRGRLAAVVAASAVAQVAVPVAFLLGVLV